jgi:hypothetical protein
MTGGGLQAPRRTLPQVRHHRVCPPWEMGVLMAPWIALNGQGVIVVHKPLLPFGCLFITRAQTKNNLDTYTQNCAATCTRPCTGAPDQDDTRVASWDRARRRRRRGQLRTLAQRAIGGAASQVRPQAPGHSRVGEETGSKPRLAGRNPDWLDGTRSVCVI